MRAVLDPNVLISALLAPSGTPARVLGAWVAGAFELVVSESLLAELERALGYPKLRARVEPSEVRELVDLLRQGAEVINDPDDPPEIRSADPDDNYLIALAASARAILVSGDRHLLTLRDRLPVRSAAEFLALLEAGPGTDPNTSAGRTINDDAGPAHDRPAQTHSLLGVSEQHR